MRAIKITPNIVVLVIAFAIFVEAIGTDGEWFIGSVGSNSMEPTLQYGDYVVVKKPTELKVGDIIAFRNSQGRMIVHRIVEKTFRDEQEVYRTKGDNLDEIDTWVVTQDSIIGIVLYVLSKEEIMIIIVFYAIIIIYASYGLIKEIKDGKQGHEKG